MCWPEATFRIVYKLLSKQRFCWRQTKPMQRKWNGSNRTVHNNFTLITVTHLNHKRFDQHMSFYATCL